MPTAKKQIKNCLIEGCDKKDKILTRGLCHNHYQMIRKLVEKKQRTWKEFEKVGMALSSSGAETRKSFYEMLIKKGLK